MTLKKVFMSAVDGGCSNAFRPILENLREIPNEKRISVGQLRGILCACSDKWEKEIDKVVDC